MIPSIPSIPSSGDAGARHTGGVSNGGAPAGYAVLRAASEEGGRQIFTAPEEGSRRVYAPLEATV